MTDLSSGVVLSLVISAVFEFIKRFAKKFADKSGEIAAESLKARLEKKLAHEADRVPKDWPPSGRSSTKSIVTCLEPMPGLRNCAGIP